MYPEVFDCLASGRRLPKQHPLAKFDMSLDKDQLLLISGRIRDPQDSSKSKTLIPLSLKSPLTKLLISTLHRVYSHAGVSILLCILAVTYHIPGLKNYLKMISRNCPTCQKAYSRPLCQRIGLLPLSRTTTTMPFNITGVDFAGPLQIRQGYTRRPVKVK